MNTSITSVNRIAEGNQFTNHKSIQDPQDNTASNGSAYVSREEFIEMVQKFNDLITNAHN